VAIKNRRFLIGDGGAAADRNRKSSSKLFERIRRKNEKIYLSSCGVELDFDCL
jgi:hypothetical protein